MPELGTDGVQGLPPEDLRRFAFQMVTRSGKTWAMAVVWSRFHRPRAPGSGLTTNFLVVVPNVIVYQRSEKDFANNRIFHELPLLSLNTHRECKGRQSTREAEPQTNEHVER